MLLRSRKHSKKQPGCFFLFFDLPKLTLHVQGAMSICQAKSMQAPSGELSSSTRRLQTSISPGP